jgi:YD repeat-containing protein
VTYIWDANGNLLSDGASTYTFDHANRLKSATQGSNTYTYAYNGIGNRVSQAVNGGCRRATCWIRRRVWCRCSRQGRFIDALEKQSNP